MRNNNYRREDWPEDYQGGGMDGEPPVEHRATGGEGSHVALTIPAGDLQIVELFR